MQIIEACCTAELVDTKLDTRDGLLLCLLANLTREEKIGFWILRCGLLTLGEVQCITAAGMSAWLFQPIFEIVGNSYNNDVDVF